MHHLSIDLETFSGVDIKKSGARRYIADPDFEILLLAYSLDGEPPSCIELAQGEVLPEWLSEAIVSPNYIKHAYNASFEWSCLSRYFGRQLPREQWRCTMLKSLYSGYAAGLSETGEALGLPEDKRKLAVGKALIKYFCMPCAPTRANGGRRRNYPRHDPERWRLFKEYCIRDVLTELEIEKRLEGVKIPDFIQKEWETDLVINSRGVAVDMKMTEGALELEREVEKELICEARQISGIENPKSVKQLTDWLEKECGCEISGLNKTAVSELMRGDNSPEVQRMLEIRQELGKTSNKKYDAVKEAICPDGRVGGLLQFYGANRTGRWAGRLVQLQNLPRTYLPIPELARELTTDGKLDALKAIYGSVRETLSQLIRTVFIPSEGNILIDADFSAIEARIISWLADEKWRLEVFSGHGKIYEASASRMFGVPIERIKKGNPEYALRSKGKVAELALGYQGGTGALIKMGALDMGIPESELNGLVERWRESNRHIKELWHNMNFAAVQVIKYGGEVSVGKVRVARELDTVHGLDSMTVALPSGRRLYYVSPRLEKNSRGELSVTYLGVNDKGKWGRIETYGGKLVENCVQGIARDCLALVLERLEKVGIPVVFHVHDEAVIDCRPDITLDRVLDIMREPMPWALDLPLNAEGWTGKFFKKD